MDDQQYGRHVIANLSIEEENLSAIPFAVLERRVGKNVGKINVSGTKILPDGTQIKVLWQVQGSSDVGLPTEQDLDIFVALGALTFRSNFSKTVSFSGREIARILNIHSVHGKFYQRLKVAMDRFIPLRFRALAETDTHEEVKWVNVFQEATFSLDRATGRCTGTVTWTDKLIQSMDSGFFRLLDAGRYMDLDGLTAKYLYRFLAVAFEQSEVVVLDIRQLATEHLGIFRLPRHFSRLMQTLEPAFEQLIRIRVLGSFHVVEASGWRIALHRHSAYVPERHRLSSAGPVASTQSMTAYCQNALERSGWSSESAEEYSQHYSNDPAALYQLSRGARLVEEMKNLGVLPHAALALVEKVFTAKPCSEEGITALDWCEIAVETCRLKKSSGQPLRNPPGLLMKIAKDETTQKRLVSKETVGNFQRLFRERERAALRGMREAEERDEITRFEQFRQAWARKHFDEISEVNRRSLRRQKVETLQQQGRLERIPAGLQEQEIDELILQDLARKAPPFERWRLRRCAQQAVLPFAAESPAIGVTAAAKSY